MNQEEPDGYIQTAFTLSDRQRWSPRTRSDHEGYVAGYFLEAAIAHHIMTEGKDTRLYDAAKKLANCWYENIGPPPKQPWYDEHQAMEIALVRFGRYINQLLVAALEDRYPSTYQKSCHDVSGKSCYVPQYNPVDRLTPQWQRTEQPEEFLSPGLT